MLCYTPLLPPWTFQRRANPEFSGSQGALGVLRICVFYLWAFCILFVVVLRKFARVCIQNRVNAKNYQESLDVQDKHSACAEFLLKGVGGVFFGAHFGVV